MRTKADKPVALTLYITRYCHLCTEMELALLPWQQRLGFRLELKDIDEVPGLDEIYGERVPVLMHGEQEICAGRLDPERLQHALSMP